MKPALRYTIISLILLLVLSLSACTSAAQAPTTSSTPAASPTPASITLTDGLGKSFAFETPYQKIVSLAPSNTEILFAIGAGNQVVARDTFSDYPEAAKQVKDIGGGWGEIDTEAIVALAPDLILAAEINAVEQVKSLEDLGLNVYYLSNPTTLDGMYDNLRTVAQLTGHESETEGLIESLKSRVADIVAKIGVVTEKPLVFYELDGSDPSAPWTSGPGTFVDLLLTQAGGENLGNLLDSSWAQISLENLIIENPEVILLGDAVWGGVTPEAVAARSGWNSLAAVQNGKVFPFDDNLISRPGPRMVDGLEQLAKLLHPDLFQ
jgi:cobalamin transport system substrate-binding protein